MGSTPETYREMYMRSGFTGVYGMNAKKTFESWCAKHIEGVK
jgi:hypothetical protein